MTLEDLGFRDEIEEYRLEEQLDSFLVGRVSSEHKERYQVKTATQEYDSELIGNLRFTATGRDGFPAVGDWVALSEYDENKALIHAIFPRFSMISRQAVGKTGQKQIIATNIDFGLVIQAVDRDFNINRMERYLTICYESKVTPIIILTKIDLISESELESIKNQIAERIKNIQVISISNESGIGHEDLISIIHPGKTYCLLGSSGVGKSSLLNRLTGKNLMQTGLISSSNNKGRHVTSHRELVVLDSGGIFIDNPGMREVGLTDSSVGLEITFDDIKRLAYECKFKDCTHTSEKGCAILEALDEERIDQDSYFNFQKLQKEQMHYESTVLEKKKKDKDLGKIIKTFKKNRNQNKY